ncbi:GTP pyrophosphokinase [Chromobacterium piscinae]|uniref:GTP pyrophosphokinase n=1 Tax=Chromobacterium piscinae TaxID=686831 RepID=UPI003F81C7CD
MTIADQYLVNKPIYDRCANKIDSLLTELIQGGGIPVHQTSCRVKSLSSLKEKIIKKNNKYEEISDITDIVGLRVVTYYDDHVDDVAKLIETEFKVDWDNSIDKRKAHEPDRFGYLSLHYIVSLKEARCALPEYKDFSDVRFEIQIRTLLQHAWAEIEHDLGYKSGREIPNEFRRKFSRLASFLEEVDEAFVSVRNGLIDYAEKFNKEIQHNSWSMGIDKITLDLFLRKNGGAIRADEAVAAAYQSVIDNDPDFDGLISNIERFQINDLVVLEKLLSENIEAIVKIAHNFQRYTEKESSEIAGYVDSSVSRGVSIYILIYVLVYKSEGRRGVVRYLTELDPHDLDENEKYADMVEFGCRGEKPSWL